MVFVKRGTTKRTSGKFHKDKDNRLRKRARITHEKENIDIIPCSVILNQIKRVEFIKSVSNTMEEDIIFLKEVKSLSSKYNRFNRRKSSSKFPYNLRNSLPCNVKSDTQVTSKICIIEEKRTKLVSPETVKQSIKPCFVVLNKMNDNDDLSKRMKSCSVILDKLNVENIKNTKVLTCDDISCKSALVISPHCMNRSQDVAIIKAKNYQISQADKETVNGLECDSIKDIASPTYICTHCNKTLPSVKALYYHTCNTKTKRGFLCDICHKNFDFNRLLEKHRLTHNAKAFLSCSETVKCRRVSKYSTKKDFPPKTPKKESGAKKYHIWDKNNSLLKSQQENILPRKVLIESIFLKDSLPTTSKCRFSKIWVSSSHKIFD